MANRTANGEPPMTAVEPASITEITRLVVAALVALGVFESDDATWNTIAVIIGGLISIGLTWYTRRKSTPLAKPRDSDGIPLMPVPERSLDNPPPPQP